MEKGLTIIIMLLLIGVGAGAYLIFIKSNETTGIDASKNEALEQLLLENKKFEYLAEKYDLLDKSTDSVKKKVEEVKRTEGKDFSEDIEENKQILLKFIESCDKGEADELFCYLYLLDIPGWDLQLCEEVPETLEGITRNFKSHCKDIYHYALAEKNNNSDLCEKIENPSNKDKCYLDGSLWWGGGLELCEKIVDREYKDDCYNWN